MMKTTVLSTFKMRVSLPGTIESTVLKPRKLADISRAAIKGRLGQLWIKERLMCTPNELLIFTEYGDEDDVPNTAPSP